MRGSFTPHRDHLFQKIPPVCVLYSAQVDKEVLSLEVPVA
uniref:Uncharacterized protein n=1 Tax=Anguilla anguilla TaxID=7936 RepID=A0A0E9XUT9_ANGAN